MKHGKKFLLAALSLVLACALLTAGAHASGLFDFSFGKKDTVTISQEEYDRLKKYAQMDEILQYIEMWYLEEPDVDKLLESATRGLMSGLGDPYTFYYNEAEWKEMWEDDEGEYGGVGLELLGSAETNLVTITRVFRDTPAQRAGVRKGDILVRVEDIEVNAYTMQNAVNVMRGTLNEEVELEVRRNGEYITFRMPRATITVNRVEYTMLADGVGYIMLYQFAGESQKEFAAALSDLRAQGAQSLVVDLRDNGGGWVQAAIEIADLFLDEDVLVYTQDRFGTKDEYKTAAGEDDIPLVFLVNGHSASASEILAGGLQDKGRATLVGTQTFGKGIVQTVIPLENNTRGFQMTYAQYFLPSGTAVHKVGVAPDVLSEMPEDLASTLFELGDMSDPQLKTAWETARGMIRVQD